METNKIPNIQIENIGTWKKPHNVIKGFIELPCWTGYFLTEETNYLITTNVVTNGRIDLWVEGEIKADGSFYIDPEQINCYFFLVEHQERIKHSILEELKKKFPGLLSNEYASWDHEDESLPKISDLTPEFDFKNYIGPASISIEEDIKDEIAYIKWHFQCLWDPEHGFEVITHKDRVIDLSPETDIFKINVDNGTYKELEKELKNRKWKVPKKKKVVAILVKRKSYKSGSRQGGFLLSWLEYPRSSTYCYHVQSGLKQHRIPAQQQALNIIVHAWWPCELQH